MKLINENGKKSINPEQLIKLNFLHIFNCNNYLDVMDLLTEKIIFHHL